MASETSTLPSTSTPRLRIMPVVKNLASTRTLALEYKTLLEEPVEGFRVKLRNESSLYEWEVAIFGPPDTLYAGAYFKALMKFPLDYPYSPPSIRFLTKLWHPNIYENGELCISILHPSTPDPRSGELPCERWNPTQNVRTILLSVISLLNEPNTFSPANIDASIMYRRWMKSKGKDTEYPNIIRKQVLDTWKDAKADNVEIPITLEQYCVKITPPPLPNEFALQVMGPRKEDLLDEDYLVDDDDDYCENDDDDDDEDDDKGEMNEGDAKECSDHIKE